MSYTHVMINNMSLDSCDVPPKFKKGDFTTLHKEWRNIAMESGVGYEFEEHMGCIYASSFFVPIPPPKTVYVSVPETIKESVPETILN